MDYENYYQEYVSNIFDDSFYVQEINVPNNLYYSSSYYIGFLFLFLGLVFVFFGNLLRQ